MPPRKRQKMENPGGHTPLDIPATRNSRWYALANKMHAHTKDIERGSSATDDSRTPENNNSPGPLSGSQASGIKTPFEGTLSNPAAAPDPVPSHPPGYLCRTNPESELSKVGQTDTEKPEQKKHNPGQRHAEASSIHTFRFNMPPHMDLSRLYTSMSDSNPKMEEPAAGTERKGEAAGTGGEGKVEVEAAIVIE